MRVGIICLFLLFPYASPMCKCWRTKSHEQAQPVPVLEQFVAILERQRDPRLVSNVREFIEAIGSDKTKKDFVKKCLSVRLPSGNVLLIFSRYAENVEDFGWIIGKMEWCGGKNFVWQEMSFPNTTIKLSFFHTLSVVKNFRCVEFMFYMICRYAPTPRALRNFLLYKNESDDCILTCISYSSVLSSEEKIHFLDLFIHKIRENAEEIYSKDRVGKNVGDEVELSLLTKLNESLLFEVIRNALVVHRKFDAWVSPFIRKLVELVRDCSGDLAVDAVKDFVNKVKITDKGESLTALDLLFIHDGLSAVPLPAEQMLDIQGLIDFLRSVGAKRFQELQGAVI